MKPFYFDNFSCFVRHTVARNQMKVGTKVVSGEVKKRRTTSHARARKVRSEESFGFVASLPRHV